MTAPLPKPVHSGSRKQKNKLRNTLLIVSSFIIILAGLHAAKAILAPIFMATFFAILLLPPLQWICSKGISRGLALTIEIAVVLICGLSIMTIIGSQLTQFARDLPSYRDRFNDQLMNYNLDLGDFIPFFKTEDPEKNEPENQPPVKSEGSYFPYPVERKKAQTLSPSVDSKMTSVSYTEPVPNGTTSGSDEVTKKVSSSKTPAKNSDPRSIRRAGSPPPALGWTEDPVIPGVFDSNETHQEGFFSSGRGLFGDSKESKLGTDDLAKEKKEHSSDKGSSEKDESEQTAAGEQDPNEDFPHYGAVSWARASEDAVKASSHELFRFLGGLTGELSVLASSTFISMLLVIFMLLEASKLPLKAAFALRNRTSMTSSRIRQVALDIRNYMMIKTFVSILVGLLVTILLLVTNVQYPILWGFVAFLLNFIPNIGSVVAAIPPIILATVDHGLFIGFVDAAFFVIINCGIGYILEPKLLGNGLDLSPLVVLLSLLFCGWLLGPVGMFLSPPLAVIIKIILKSFPETEWIAILMANSVPKEENKSVLL